MGSESKFKVGDRVRVYQGQGAPETQLIGEVAGIANENSLCVAHGTQKAYVSYYHPKQCRRLVKKKRREWWILEHDLTVNSLSNPHDFKSAILVREVKSNA